MENKNMNNYLLKSILEIGNIERAIQGKIYPAGSILIPLSAMANTPTAILKESQEVETRYAVLVVNKENNAEYIFISIQKEWERFIHKYATTINLQFNALKHFVIPVHEDKETQDYIAEQISYVDKAIEKENEIIEAQTVMKKHFLNDMFVN